MTAARKTRAGATRRRPAISPPTDAAAGMEKGALSLATGFAMLYRLGAQHYAAGRLAEAEIIFRGLVKLRPDHADSLHVLGVIAYHQGRNQEAVELIAEALRLNTNRSDYASNLGNALQRLSRFADAELCYRAAIAVQPEHAAAHNNLAAVLRDTGRAEEAIGSCLTALELRPGYPDAHNNLAIAMSDLGWFEDAAAHCQAALDGDPGRTETRNNLANILSHLGRLDEAMAQYEQALAEQPNAAEIHHNYGMSLLYAGRYAEGWREYEWRWRTMQLAAARRAFEAPQWDGTPLGERTLLIHAEQGFGDTLQFCRYIPRIAGRVIVEVQPALAPLLRGQLGPHAVIAAGEPLPAFDLHCPMISLAGLIEPEPVPPQGAYLAADAERAAGWTARLAALPGLKVGLVWAGGARLNQPTLAAVNRRRSTQLSALAPLMDLEGVSFVSLQKGCQSPEQDQAPFAGRLSDFTDELRDFADTAALVEALDLVITVDTAVAHLAGALGKPVWMLNRFDSCWRWRAEGETTAWYPSLRQFRQPSSGDWASPVAAMVEALAGVVAGVG